MRLDQALVKLGLCASREQAVRAVMAGHVTVNEQVATKPSHTVRPRDRVRLSAVEKFVSRGGYKLEHALNCFHVLMALCFLSFFGPV